MLLWSDWCGRRHEDSCQAKLTMPGGSSADVGYVGSIKSHCQRDRPQSVFREGQIHVDDCQECGPRTDIRTLQELVRFVYLCHGALDECVKAMVRGCLQRQVRTNPQLGGPSKPMQSRRRRPLQFVQCIVVHVIPSNAASPSRS